MKKNPVQVALKEVQGGISADLKMPECTVANVKVLLDEVQGKAIAILTMPECTEVRVESLLKNAKIK